MEIKTMEARFQHWIQNKKGHCEFISYNSDFFPHNSDFLTIVSLCRSSDFSQLWHFFSQLRVKES